MDHICVRLGVAWHILPNMKVVGLQVVAVLLSVIGWDEFDLLVCEAASAKECDFGGQSREVLGRG